MVCIKQTLEMCFCIQVAITFSCGQEVCKIHFESPACLISTLTVGMWLHIQFYILAKHLFHHTLFMDSGYVLTSHS